MRLDDIERAPAQIRGNQIAIGLFAVILQRNYKAFGAMGTDVETGTADDHGDCFSPSNADLLRCPRMRSKIVGDMLLALIHAHLLVGANLANHLDASQECRGLIHKGCVPIEGIRDDTVHCHLGMVDFPLPEQP